MKDIRVRFDDSYTPQNYEGFSTGPAVSIYREGTIVGYVVHHDNITKAVVLVDLTVMEKVPPEHDRFLQEVNLDDLEVI